MTGPSSETSIEAHEDDASVDIDPAELTGVFAAPRWLRDVGLTAWLLVGVALVLVGTVWLLSLTEAIVLPVIAAGVIAAVSSPLVAWLQRHRVPRPLGAIMLLVGFVALGVLVVYIVLAGITSQVDDLGSYLDGAESTIPGWLNDLGVDPDKARAALGGAGTHAAIGMIVVQLFANSVLQQLVQPIAMGAALGIHPLAVLIVKIAGGALFGATGLILAAPITSAITRISADVARARGVEDPVPA